MHPVLRLSGRSDTSTTSSRSKLEVQTVRKTSVTTQTSKAMSKAKDSLIPALTSARKKLRRHSMVDNGPIQIRLRKSSSKKTDNSIDLAPEVNLFCSTKVSKSTVY